MIQSMNKIIFGFLLSGFYLFFGFNCIAQHIKIVADEDGTPLQFATLINHTHPNLVSANVNGLAEMNAMNGDSIAVSYVGFKTSSFIYNSNASQTIRLFKDANVLSTITIVNCKKMKQMEYSNKDDVIFIVKPYE